MSRWNFCKVRRKILVPPTTSASYRHLHSSIPSRSTVTLPLYDTHELQSRQNVKEVLREKFYEDLEDSFSRDRANPSRVWGHYMGLTQNFRAENVPLDIHQLVLRRCVPPTAELRQSTPRLWRSSHTQTVPYRYERRLQVVIQNMRTGGWLPTLEDYHFILEQFAAVGHHIGCRNVLHEVMSSGLRPEAKTFGLCLQALCQRLALPCLLVYRPTLVQEINHVSDEILHEMWTRKIPFTSINMGLALRVLQETISLEGFERLIRIGYGIDLANPDRLPLEYLGLSEGVHSETKSAVQGPLPFSTAALNTTIDTLGQLASPSKLVQAFEVLTTALPQGVESHSLSFDEDEDDFGVALESHSSSTFQPPYAEPNTTTYSILLKHLSRTKHVIFSRHYLLQALHTEYAINRRIRGLVSYDKPISALPSPNVSVNRVMLLSVFGLANRYRRRLLMKWVLKVAERVLRRKRYWVKYYSELWVRAISERDDAAGADSSKDIEQPVKPITESPDTPISPPSSSVSAEGPSGIGKKSEPGIFDVDFDAPPAPPPQHRKSLDIPLHLTILRRDVGQIVSLTRQIQYVLGRTTQRIKERVGRRVWSGKGIYIPSERRRMPIPRNAWRNLVIFKQGNRTLYIPPTRRTSSSIPVTGSRP